jgi:hypothetical protein
MNKFILGIIKVYVIASIVYIGYMIYLKIYKKPIFSDELIEYPELLEKYNNEKKKRMTVFIIGVIIGLILLLLFDNITPTALKSKNVHKIINDVSDIHVI